jgi:tRNA nucleotidyltransferase (CCA-adding enzyme)
MNANSVLADRKLYFPQDPWKIVHRLQEHNFEAYFVGGCVRDALLGLTPKDYDITTTANVNEVFELFIDDFTALPTGAQYGTVSVIINQVSYEVTTFRKDGKYSDSRHPDEATFSSSLMEETRNALKYFATPGYQYLFPQ